MCYFFWRVKDLTGRFPPCLNPLVAIPPSSLSLTNSFAVSLSSSPILHLHLSLSLSVHFPPLSFLWVSHFYVML